METHREPLSPGMGSPSSSRSRAPDAFTLLVRAYTRLVRIAAWQAGAPEADLADVAQEVFLRLFEAMRRGLDVSTPLDGWLRRTTYTVTRDRRALARNARENVTMTGDVDVDERAPNPEARLLIDELHRLVNAILDELPVGQRDVLVMSDMGEMPMSEIAKDLKIPEGTGYSRLRTARTTFRQKLQQRQASGGLAVLPFALWEPSDLFAVARVPPSTPPGFEDEVLRRLAASPAGTAAAAAAGTAGVVKAGLVLTGKQIAAGIVPVLIAGAVLHAGYLAWDRPKETASVSAIASDHVEARGPAGTAMPSATVAQVAESAADEGRRTGTASPGDDAKRAVAAAEAVEASERTLLINARGAIERGDPQAALALLARVRSARHAPEREELRRLARAAQDGGP
jgi:RNA polymerase sigma-70 factor (ECF subfamily)